MKVCISKGRAAGQVAAPPSKSMAHRALICAALVGALNGDASRQGGDFANPTYPILIKNVGLSQDVRATMECLEALGARFEKGENQVTVKAPVKIFSAQSSQGLGDLAFGAPELSDTSLFCGESGSTLRFMLPLAMAACRPVTFTGTGRLMERPLEVYEEICADKDISFERTFDGDGSTKAVTVEGRLTGGRFSVRGDVSSQFVTGLLLILPLLAEDSEIHFSTALKSRPYVDMTVNVMETFGVKATVGEDYGLIKVEGRQRYRPPESPLGDGGAVPFYEVEGDYSGAAFFCALNYIGSQKNRGNVRVTSLKKDSLQGDKAFIGFFEQLVSAPANIDISDCPDLAPILTVVAAANHGCKLTGTDRLRIKESDRGKAMASELEKMGVNVKLGSDFMIVPRGDIHEPTEDIDAHNDHRIAMAMSILCTLTGGRITGADSVKKSFPDFYQRLADMGIGVSYSDF